MARALSPLNELPGFRRRFLVTPGPNAVTAAVEDDYHCMAVTLHHDGAVIGAVEPVMDRAPWTTCPGAPAVLRQTFEGVALAEAATRGEKQANCTHLHDLATLAAAHAGDAEATCYDILVSDAVDGLNTAEIHRDGTTMLRFEHRDDVLVSPEGAAGLHLFKLKPWIQTLDPATAEAARLLQWASLIAHGRAIPLERQSDATRMPPNCFTFQPDRAAVAKRVGRIIDFSSGEAAPLDHFDGAHFGERRVA
jgi:hypothetical protein